MSDELVVSAPAKLNLFLHVIGRRSDGYHRLQTLFQLLEYGDQLVFQERAGTTIELEGEFGDTPLEANLIYRAALAVAAALPEPRGVRIQVDKRLPLGGGLGGGSSNAATTLLALNQLWRARLPAARLQELALQLGADVPLFVAGRTAFGEGVGEVLTPVSIEPVWYLLIVPDCRIATRDVFADPQLTRNTAPITIARFPRSARAADFLASPFRNDCEAVARRLYPAVDAALKWLGQWSTARLTGTGATVFAAFDSEEHAKHVLASMPDHWLGIVTRGMDESPLLAQLRSAGRA